MSSELPFLGLVRDPLLLVYQMPKAGSQTIEATLQRSSLGWRVVRLHFLCAERARQLGSLARAPESTETWKHNARVQLELRNLIRRVLCARRWRSWFRKKHPKLHVISAVREPIGLVLSSTFENFYETMGGDEARALARCQQVLTSPRSLKSVWNWFDLELKPFVGIDVFERPFPRERGYAIYENRFARALVYRFEALPLLGQMLEEFLGGPIPQIVRRNIGEEKEYARVYRSVREKFRLPADLVRTACDSRMMRHFYSAEERRRFALSWSETAPSETAGATGLAAAAAA